MHDAKSSRDAHTLFLRSLSDEATKHLTESHVPLPCEIAELLLVSTCPPASNLVCVADGWTFHRVALIALQLSAVNLDRD